MCFKSYTRKFDWMKSKRYLKCIFDIFEGVTGKPFTSLEHRLKMILSERKKIAFYILMDQTSIQLLQ